MHFVDPVLPMIPLPDATPQPTIVFDFSEVLTNAEVVLGAGVVAVITVMVGRSENAISPDVVDDVAGGLGWVSVMVVLEMTIIA